MRIAITAVIALLVGLVFGGFQSRSELADLTEKYAALSEKSCGPSGVAPVLLEAISAAASRTNDEGGPLAISTAVGKSKNGGMDSLDPSASPISVQFGNPDAELPDVDAMTELMAIRANQSRQALSEQTDATEDQLIDVDIAVDQMNDALLALSDDLVDMVANGEPTRRDVLVFGVDAITTILDAEDAIFAAFDADQLEGVDDAALDPFSYVDASVIEAFMSLGE